MGRISHGVVFPGLLLVAVSGFSPRVAGAEERACLECHGDPSLVAVTGPGRLDLHVDRAAYAAGVCASLACTDCRAGSFAAVPHRVEPGSAMTCIACHAGPWQEVERQLAASRSTRRPGASSTRCSR
jgi:hypothetical protein